MSYVIPSDKVIILRVFSYLRSEIKRLLKVKIPIRIEFAEAKDDLFGTYSFDQYSDGRVENSVLTVYGLEEELYESIDTVCHELAHWVQLSEDRPRDHDGYHLELTHTLIETAIRGLGEHLKPYVESHNLEAWPSYFYYVEED